MKRKQTNFKRMYFILFCIGILFLFFSCQLFNKSEEEEKIKELLGEKIIFPQSLNIFYDDTLYSINDSELINGDKKIVSYINASCPPCLHKLAKWEYEFFDSMDTSNIKFLFVLHHDRYSEFKRAMSWRIPIDYPLILDTTNIFLTRNNLIKTNSRTFLLNEDNEIQLVGDPFASQKLKKLYINKLVGND